jgi:hypothetical protein
MYSRDLIRNIAFNVFNYGDMIDLDKWDKRKKYSDIVMMINNINDINVDKLLSEVQDIKELYFEKNILEIETQLMNILFEKYENLFENLSEIINYTDQELYVPSKIKKLEIKIPYNITSSEKLNIERLYCYCHTSDLKDCDLNQIFNFETIKSFQFNGSMNYWSSYFGKMLNLESLTCDDRVNVDETDENIINHLDKLSLIDGYCGMYDLPKNITRLYYAVNTVRKLPDQLEYLTLIFDKNLGFTEFTNDNVTDLTIRTSILMDDVHLFFPNVENLVFDNSYKDDNTFLYRLLKNKTKLKKLYITIDEEFDYDSISELPLDDLNVVFYIDIDKHVIKSNTIKSLSIIANTDRIELDTKELSSFEYQIVRSYNDTTVRNVVISSTQDKILSKITIENFKGSLDISEFKTDLLIIQAYIGYPELNLTVPSYYEQLKIINMLSASWINNDVKTLIIDRIHARDGMIIDCDIVNALFLKKIIIIKNEFAEFEWNKYIYVSNDCEIEFQYV